MPSVASTCVRSAGPPPVKRYTLLKSPSVQIIDRIDEVRYSVCIDGQVMNLNFSQLGPSRPVKRKMSELMIPHSGLSMKRIDRIVGIDGTAQGRMNTSDSHLIHVRACTKKPDRNNATTILRLMPTIRNTSVLMTDRAKTGSSTSLT